MIERIFIPTVNRPNDQITYEALPDVLKDRVTLVVQEWERDQYSYDCDYLVLPSHLNKNDNLCLAKTRDIIHKAGRTMKYGMLDDDLILVRRNAKYWHNEPNMLKSKRHATGDDIVEFIDSCSDWLDEPNVSFCSPSHVEFAPDSRLFCSNAAMTSYGFYNGVDFSNVLDDLPTTVVRYGEDTLFVLSLLSRGYGNRISNVFCVDNKSLGGKLTDTVWADSSYDAVWADHNRIQELYPRYFKVLLDDDGNRIKGGFRDYGKVELNYKKCFNSFHRNLMYNKMFKNLTDIGSVL
jgi:hypothetical protein